MMIKHSLCKSERNAKSKLAILSVYFILFCTNKIALLYIFFAVVSGENQRVQLRRKVKRVKSQANSERVHENQKLELVNEIQRNDSVGEKDVKSYIAFRLLFVR